MQFRFQEFPHFETRKSEAVYREYVKGEADDTVECPELCERN